MKSADQIVQNAQALSEYVNTLNEDLSKGGQVSVATAAAPSTTGIKRELQEERKGAKVVVWYENWVCLLPGGNASHHEDKA